MTTRLRDALDDLRSNGWFKGATTNVGCYPVICPRVGSDPAGLPGCMWTAVGRQGMEADLDIFALAEVCKEQFPERSANSLGSIHDPEVVVIFTNNHPETTFEDVEMLMEKAAINRESRVV